MPNWCDNTLTVAGPAELIAGFVQENKGVPQDEGRVIPLTFEATCPSPEDVGDTWHAWSTSHWGTKWDLDEDTIFEYEPGQSLAIYVFSSAWSPPTNWLATTAKAYPELVFLLEYEEAGNGFRGVDLYKNGSCEYDVDISDYVF